MLCEECGKNQAEVLVRFTELFISERYDAVVLLGDRYETLAIAIAAGNTSLPPGTCAGNAFGNIRPGICRPCWRRF